MSNLSFQEGMLFFPSKTKKVNFEISIIMFLPSKCCLIVHFLWKMNDSHHVTFQGSGLSYYTRNPRIMIITECYKSFTGVKKVGIFINTFSSSDQERKIPRSTKAAVFQRRCFEAILLCLWLTCVCDGWRDTQRGWGRLSVREKKTWWKDCMNGRQQGNTALSSDLHLYDHTLRPFIFLATMIGFIFAGFRINDIVQSWPLEFSCYAFSVNPVKKMREAESFGCKKKIKNKTKHE